MDVFFHSVGVSILSNICCNEGFNFKYANIKDESEIESSEDRELLAKWRKLVESKDLSREDDARKNSAELNTFLSFLKSKKKEAKDFCHYLIITDTCFGDICASGIEKWLRDQGCNKIIKLKFDNLNTSEPDSFIEGAKKLYKNIKTIMEDEKKRKAKIHFNLSGGFKAVLSFLNVIALLEKADCFYLFEGSSNLLTLPSLPMKIDFTAFTDEEIKSIRRLSLDIALDDDLNRVSESFILKIDNLIGLSHWGELVWDNIKKDQYEKKLLDSPYDKIEYSQKFRSQTNNLNSQQFLNLNKRVDELCCYIKTGGGENPNTLDLRNYKSGAKDEVLIDAWSSMDAKRIIVRKGAENKYTLLELIKHF